LAGVRNRQTGDASQPLLEGGSTASPVGSTVRVVGVVLYACSHGISHAVDGVDLGVFGSVSR
jgi:hypothetical protein